MRRKNIPSRKHHGIRDPIKQNESRLAKIKNKINNPPEKGSTEKLSYRFSEFIKLKDQAKCGKPIKLRKVIDNEDKPKPRTKHNKPDEATRNYKEVRPITQLPNEADEDYLKRVNRITYECIKEAEYEAKYGVEVIRDPKSGKITIKKKPKDELEELAKQKRRKTKNAVDKKQHKIDPKLSKEIIKELLRDEKEAKKTEKSGEFKKDIVQFGEIVHAPPNLSSLPRRAQKCDTVPRPGKKNNLLLKSLLENNKNAQNSSKGESVESKTTKKEITTKMKIDLKGKRKDLPDGTRMMLEHQQKRAVELYREMKKNKSKS